LAGVAVAVLVGVVRADDDVEKLLARNDELGRRLESGVANEGLDNAELGLKDGVEELGRKVLGPTSGLTVVKGLLALNSVADGSVDNTFVVIVAVVAGK
jgi:hypothetical protein